MCNFWLVACLECTQQPPFTYAHQFSLGIPLSHLGTPSYPPMDVQRCGLEPKFTPGGRGSGVVCKEGSEMEGDALGCGFACLLFKEIPCTKHHHSHLLRMQAGEPDPYPHLVPLTWPDNWRVNKDVVDLRSVGLADVMDRGGKEREREREQRERDGLAWERCERARRFGEVDDEEFAPNV